MWRDAHADMLEGAALVEPLISVDPGGLIPRACYDEYPVEPWVSVQNSPPTNPVAPGSAEGYGRPADGPFATVWARYDLDSLRWWGAGYSTNWEAGEYSANLPPMNLPSDGFTHFDPSWSPYYGDFPPISRNPPPSYGFLIPDFDPNLVDYAGG